MFNIPKTENGSVCIAHFESSSLSPSMEFVQKLYLLSGAHLNGMCWEFMTQMLKYWNDSVCICAIIVDMLLWNAKKWTLPLCLCSSIVRRAKIQFNIRKVAQCMHPLVSFWYSGLAFLEWGKFMKRFSRNFTCSHSTNFVLTHRSTWAQVPYILLSFVPANRPISRLYSGRFCWKTLKL